MGIDVHDYLVYGRKLPWSNKFHEAYDDDYDTNGNGNTVEVIMDGMSGEYIVVGPILRMSGNHRYMPDGDDDVFQEINLADLPALEDEYKRKFCEAFPKFKEWMDEPFVLLSFTHYS